MLHKEKKNSKEVSAILNKESKMLPNENFMFSEEKFINKNENKTCPEVPFIVPKKDFMI